MLFQGFLMKEGCFFHLSSVTRRKTDTTNYSYGSDPVKNVFERMDETMTRKQLEDLGLTKEQANSIIRINGNDIENAKAVAGAEVANLKTENGALLKKVADRDKQIEVLKKSVGDNENLQKQIADLKATNMAQADGHAKEMQQLRMDAIVEKALNVSGAKNIKAVKALLELEDVKLSDDGTIKGLAEQIERLKSDDGSKFMFNETEQAQNQRQAFTGIQLEKSTTVPNSKQTGYDTRLAEAILIADVAYAMGARAVHDNDFRTENQADWAKTAGE